MANFKNKFTQGLTADLFEIVCKTRLVNKNVFLNWNDTKDYNSEHYEGTQLKNFFDSLADDQEITST